jgi:polyribonucleotide nucleotidyltransferase
LLEEPELAIQKYTARVWKKQRQQNEFKDLIAKKREIKQQELEKERLLDLYQTGRIELSEIEPRLKAIRTKITKIQNGCALLEEVEIGSVYLLPKNCAGTIKGYLEQDHDIYLSPSTLKVWPTVRLPREG